MKYETSAGAIIYRVQKETGRLQYLLLRAGLGHWDFPKGKLEAAETREQAALREVKEETDLAITLVPGFDQSLSYYFKDKNGVLINKTVTFFVAQAPHTPVTLSYEHTEYRWLNLEDALTTLTYKNSQQILKLADRFVRHLLQDHAR